MKVKELLDKPEKWIKGTYARNSRRVSVHYGDKDAVCYCLLGAILKCHRGEVVEIYKKFAIAGIDSITIWNDNPSRTYEDVMKLVNELDL